MASRSIPEDTPDPDETVFTTAHAAEWSGKKRQTIDAAIRAGRLKAYRWPGKTALWIREKDLQQVYAHQAPPNTYERIDELERQVAVLAKEVERVNAKLEDLEDRPESPPSPTAQQVDDDVIANLRADNATLTAINELLLAEAADREDEDREIEAAIDLLRQSVEKQRSAGRAIRSSRAKYREALAQAQLPRHGPEAEPNADDT